MKVDTREHGGILSKARDEGVVCGGVKAVDEPGQEAFQVGFLAPGRS